MHSCFRFVLLMLACATASAQAPYPNRPIKFVMAYPPAGSSDVLARPIANEMSKGLGQPVLLEYKPGGGSTIAADFTAKSPPDGYTIVLLLTAHAVNATLMAKLPYDTIKDFTPITLAAVAPLVVEVHADSPIRTVRELIETAKANKGKLNYASAGPGNTSHLAVELFKLTLGIDMTHVPYKGEPQAVTDIIAGRVQLLWATPTTGLAHLKEGKLRALATNLKSRSSLLPDVPTMAEVGIPQYSVVSWAALYGPAKLPREIQLRLNKEFHDAMKRADVIALMDKQAFQMTPSTPEELGAFTKAQLEAYRGILKSIGMQPE